MKFSYKARTKEGKEQKGMVEASSRKTALDILEKYDFYVTSLKVQGVSRFFSKQLSWGRNVSRKDLVLFTRQISTMFKSSIPPLQVFRSQVNQVENSRFRAQILKMAEAIERGDALSQAFALFPKVFNSFFVSIVRSGEATGKVAGSLTYLADHLEREFNFRQQVKGALFYPLFVIVVFIGVFFVVIFFIVPKLTDILKAFDPEDLPILTRILMKFGDFMEAGGWIVAPIAFVPLVVGAVLFFRSKRFKIIFDKFSLKIPILGPFYKKIQLSSFAENFSVLITAGLPITQALRITKDIMANSVYKNILKEAEKVITRGEKMSTLLSRYPKQFPSFVIQMISTGEKTGKLSETLTDTVKFYQGEIDRTTEKLTTMLEPILILVLGIGIAILAFAVFIPLFNMGLSGGGF